ncbi:unnamed protein product [Protopolystoma xenopodis]|uniref:Uncharacterized protein n=1 Tax=Protopolystoma xenopodis TaxID=117903 RepID=A0A3S5CS25_9PLAT|nr:unnamed protein product [Protopolystoma xenopodis]
MLISSHSPLTIYSLVPSNPLQNFTQFENFHEISNTIVNLIGQTGCSDVQGTKAIAETEAKAHSKLKSNGWVTDTPARPTLWPFGSISRRMNVITTPTAKLPIQSPFGNDKVLAGSEGPLATGHITAKTVQGEAEADTKKASWSNIVADSHYTRRTCLKKDIFFPKGFSGVASSERMFNYSDSGVAGLEVTGHMEFSSDDLSGPENGGAEDLVRYVGRFTEGSLFLILTSKCIKFII